eukprot:PhM_4_TR18769/c0_g2_i1/m.4362
MCNAQIILTFSLLAVAILVIVTSSLITLRYTRPLMVLRDEMAHVAVLELDAVDLSRERSLIEEVGSMQDSFIKMVQDLMEFRAFVPPAVLAPQQDNNNIDAHAHISLSSTLNNTNNCIVEADKSRKNSLNTPVIMPTESTSDAHPLAVPPGSLNTSGGSSSLSSSGAGAASQNLLPDDPRVARLRGTSLQPFQASFMFASVRGVSKSVRPGSAAAKGLHNQFQAFVGVCINTIERLDGVVVKVDADLVVGSWNAFRPCVMHEVLACAAAIELMLDLSGGGEGKEEEEEEGNPTSRHVLVTGGKVLVGFLGTSRVRSPVVVGECMDAAPRLLGLAPLIDSQILVTDNVAQKVNGKFEFVAIDVVVNSGSNNKNNNIKNKSSAATTLYELLQNPVDAAHLQRFDKMCVPYNIAFSRLRNLRFDEALASFHDFLTLHGSEVDDMHYAHALRLAGVCAHMNRESAVGRGVSGGLGYGRVPPHWSSIGSIGEMPFSSLSLQQQRDLLPESFHLFLTTSDEAAGHNELSGEMNNNNIINHSQEDTSERRWDDHQHDVVVCEEYCEPVVESTNMNNINSVSSSPTRLIGEIPLPNI